MCLFEFLVTFFLNENFDAKLFYCIVVTSLNKTINLYFKVL